MLCHTHSLRPRTEFVLKVGQQILLLAALTGAVAFWPLSPASLSFPFMVFVLANVKFKLTVGSLYAAELNSTKPLYFGSSVQFDAILDGVLLLQLMFESTAPYPMLLFISL